MYQSKDKGFTFIELLIVMSIIGVLLSIAVANFQSFSYKAVDASAHSDYRQVKVAVMDALTRAGGADRYIARRVRGPTSLPTPLEAVYLSEDVEATVVFDSRTRRNRRPRTVTRIEVFHIEGSKSFVYTEVNGRVVEQVTERRS